MINLEKLETEGRNPRTLAIDQQETLAIVHMINEEDATIAQCVKEQSHQIAQLIDAAYNCLKQGGRLIYVGAGTSGRLGVLDASECPPTYGVSDDMVMGLIAGGTQAMFKAKEGAEDSQQLAVEDLKAISVSDKDIVVGLAASGRTPYVIGALAYANEIGAQTGSVACVSDSEIGKVAKYKVEVITGPEVVQGSTRMKAGTAQKMVLNMLSTACMIKLGKVYGNLMVDVQPTNQKLVKRAKRIIQQALSCSSEQSEQLYNQSGQDVKVAIVMGLLQIDKEGAMTLLKKSDGVIAKVIKHELPY